MTKEKQEIVEHLSDMELGQEGISKKEEVLTEKEAEFKEAVKDDKAPKKRWYIVHTYSGHENKVKVNLEKRIEYMNMADKIFRIEVPQKTVTKMKDGKKTDREEKIFPGYVLVVMIMDDDSWYVVRQRRSDRDHGFYPSGCRNGKDLI